MAARTEESAANGRAVPARFPLRERAAKVEVGPARMQANPARVPELLDRERPPRE